MIKVIFFQTNSVMKAILSDGVTKVLKRTDGNLIIRFCPIRPGGGKDRCFQERRSGRVPGRPEAQKSDPPEAGRTAFSREAGADASPGVPKRKKNIANSPGKEYNVPIDAGKEAIYP